MSRVTFAIINVQTDTSELRGPTLAEISYALPADFWLEIRNHFISGA